MLEENMAQPQAEETNMFDVLADDFNSDLVSHEAQPQAEEKQTTNEPQQEQEPVKTDSTTPQDRLKLKYNHEEKEVTLDEAKELAQKGLNYERAIERARQEARDNYIAEQGYVWDGKPIKTEAEYKEALREKEIYDSLQNRDLPPEVIDEIVESRKFRDQYKEQQQQKELEAKQQAEYDDFLKEYPETQPNSIPDEVWKYRHDMGKSLVDAMRWHENQQLKERIKKLEHNAEISKKAPINSGVTTHGSIETAEEDDFLRGFNSI